MCDAEPGRPDRVITISLIDGIRYGLQGSRSRVRSSSRSLLARRLQRTSHHTVVVFAASGCCNYAVTLVSSQNPVETVLFAMLGS